MKGKSGKKVHASLGISEIQKFLPKGRNLEIEVNSRDHVLKDLALGKRIYNQCKT